ncbi:MAG: hypothetical protein ACXVEF_12180 [Polyangiales bacterium]
MKRTLASIAALTLLGCGGTSEGSALSDSETIVDGWVDVPDDAPEEADAVAIDSDAIVSVDCAKYLGTGTHSAWVYPDGAGKLQYKPLGAAGDRIMDFSHAGYMGGGVAIPDVPVRETVKPSGKDDTAAIQAAIDKVSALTPTGGIRGAVLLGAGAFTLAGSISIRASGVVLRGSGASTVVTVSGSGRQTMRIAGSGSATPIAGETPTPIADAYVPSGATSFKVADASKLAVGDAILVQRTVTAEWIKFMGMDKLTGTWIAPGTVFKWERTITAISGNELTIDVPLSDSFDAKYVTGAVVKFSYPGRISQVGIEDIRFVAPVRAAGAEFGLVRVDSSADAWIRRVESHNFTNGIWLGPGVKRVTVEDVAMTHDPTTYVTSAAPFDFWLEASQTLVQRSSSIGGNKIWYYATQVATQGPNVLLDFTGKGMNSHVTGHQRWATGLLVDGGTIDGGVIMTDNGNLGGGEGWSMGWGVTWNTVTDVTCLAPPGAMNWAIGATGAMPTGSGLGTIESMNKPVTPTSLYLAQLCTRLGPAAVSAIGD